MMGKCVTVNQREDFGNEAALWEKCIFEGGGALKSEVKGHKKKPLISFFFFIC